MKKICFLVIFIITTYSTYSQNKFGNEWVTGSGYKFNFNTSPPTHDTFFQNVDLTLYGAGASCISDSSGYIIMNCDGMDLKNRNGILIEGGDTLIPKDYYIDEGGWSIVPQTSLILPMDAKKYYLITPTVSDAYKANVWDNKPAYNWNFDLLLYHVIDMNMNGGAGKVIQKKVPLLQNTLMKKTQMMACRHANGKDWWLLKMAGDSNMVFTFLFTQDSVYRYPNQYIPFPLSGNNDLWGQMKFSKDGKKWASTCNWGNEWAYTQADVYVADFDRCTGLLSQFQLFKAPPDMYGDSINGGLEFSPNGKLIYVTKFNTIQQLDISIGTWYNVHGPDTVNFCGYTTLHLAPDDKIYIGRYHGICKQWSVIDKPNVKYNCDFCANCLRSKSIYGHLINPPNMPNYELGEELPCWPVKSEKIELAGEDIKVYPNPTSGKLTIENGDGKLKELYNAVGQLILSTYNNEIEVSGYASGMYYIRCLPASKAGAGQTRKVVIE